MNLIIFKKAIHKPSLPKRIISKTSQATRKYNKKYDEFSHSQLFQITSFSGQIYYYFSLKRTKSFRSSHVNGIFPLQQKSWSAAAATTWTVLSEIPKIT